MNLRHRFRRLLRRNGSGWTGGGVHFPDLPHLNLKRRVVFLHISKTAGTSIVRFFRIRLPREVAISHGAFTEFPGSLEERRERLGEFQFVSGHFGYTDVAHLLPDSYSFTFLRDPVDRVLSLYKFFQWPEALEDIPAARLARNLGMEGFLQSEDPLAQEVLDNQQTWQLARSYWQEDRQALAHLSGAELLDMAKLHIGEFDLVGTTETFGDDFAHVLKALSIKEKVPEFRAFKTPEPISTDALSPAVLEILRERNALDYALLDHVREMRSKLPTA